MIVFCPTHNVAMELHHITQGGEGGWDEIDLGYMYVCPLYDAVDEPDTCIGVIDADKEGNPIYEKPSQMDMFSGIDLPGV